MNTETKKQIIEFINKNGKARAHDLGRVLGISQQAVHRHLKNLIAEGTLSKVGSAPHTFYVLPVISQSSHFPSIGVEYETFLQQYYSYVTPDGHILEGEKGFQSWVSKIKEQKRYLNLVKEFFEVRQQANLFFNKKKYIDATLKFDTTFPKTHLDKVFYFDFYSLQKFGKTKLGSLVLHAKQAQSRLLIRLISTDCKPIFESLIKDLKIDALAWVPHSLPRKISFLKELKLNLALPLPEVSLIKSYSGEVPIAQKSLSKLEERIENAEKTIFIKDSVINFKRILIIDDAVGSGSTLNAVAQKIKNLNPKVTVFGVALVGSLKGFEVIKEV